MNWKFPKQSNPVHSATFQQCNAQPNHHHQQQHHAEWQQSSTRQQQARKAHQQHVFADSASMPAPPGQHSTAGEREHAQRVRHKMQQQQQLLLTKNYIAGSPTVTSATMCPATHMHRRRTQWGQQQSSVAQHKSTQSTQIQHAVPMPWETHTATASAHSRLTPASGPTQPAHWRSAAAAAAAALASLQG